MYQDSFFTGERKEERRRALAKSLKPISVTELKELGARLFPDADDGWHQAFFGFLAEHPTATYYQASTPDQIHLVYCVEGDKGVWYVPNGVGPMQARGKAMMKELIEKQRP